MPGNIDPNTVPDYPDVLGTITGGSRLNVELVQCAFAVYPSSTALGQPFEALVLLQNICDRPLQINVAVQLPRKDSNGNRMSVITSKDEVLITLQGGETGLLHIPIVPHLPTQPSENNKLGVRFQVRGVPKTYRIVRHVHGGRPASALNMSPFRLNILREVGFTAQSMDPTTLVDSFNVIPGHVENVPYGEIRYETLWSVKELPTEQVKYAALSLQAERFVGTLSRMQIFEPLMIATEQRFTHIGLPLHPGEIMYITKILTYVMEDGLDLEDGFKLTDGRWFQRLVSVINDQYITGDSDRLVGFLYTAALHDAVRVGLSMVERTTHKTFGTEDEHVIYANEVVSALEGSIPPDLGHVYLPLVLAGLLLNAQVRGPRENLWSSVAQVREAWRGRQRLADSTFEPVSEMLDTFLYDAEEFLQRSRIPRPDAK
jgi:hypothetical protein